MRSPHFHTAILFLVLAGTMPAHSQQVNGTLVVQVTGNSQPVEQAEVTIGDRMVLTNQAGVATFELPPGKVEVHIERYGFKPQITSALMSSGAVTRLPIDLETEIGGKEEITVTARRR